jgi:hypothetical protein
MSKISKKLMKKIIVIHENEAWLTPLRAAFKKLNLPFEEWFINDDTLDLNSVPPEGIFYNRMSASAHTREHRYAPEMAANVIAWLERNGRQVINGRRALQLELRKSEQYLALQQFDIPHPKTIISNSTARLAEAVDQLNKFPFILKPNRGGKGAGVQLFYSKESLLESIKNSQIGESLDGIWLVQDYIKPVHGRIVRAEFVGGKLIYAVSIDAQNGFELCPADSCNAGDAFCPTSETTSTNKFNILDNYENEDLEKYVQFLQSNDIGIGALEYVEDKDGVKWVYDVNTNTNYNSGAEQRTGTGKEGALAIAQFLGNELERLNRENLLLVKAS